jgi:PAS domain S-box-containing protein
MLQSPQRKTFARSALSLEQSRSLQKIPQLYLKLIVDACPSGVVVLDEAGKILQVNDAWRQFAMDHGLLTDFYGVGLNYLELRKKAGDASLDEAEIAHGIRRVLTVLARDFHHQYFSRNSFNRRWIRIHAARFDLPGLCRVLVTHDDLTSTEQVSDLRGNEQERLRLLWEMTRILPWEAKFPGSTYTYVGEQAVNMLGYPVEDWYQSGFWPKHLHPDDREQAMAKCVEYSNARDNYELDYRMIARDGKVVWLHNLVTVVRENNQPKTIRGFSIDITENKQTEAALTDMSGRLINAQEDERRRVARELHDDLNQRMALLSIELEQLGQMKEPLDLRARLNDLQHQAQEISADIHRISYKLHPSKLDHLGLAAAVKSLCQELSTKGSIEIEFQQRGFPANLPNDATLCVFRIAQEALGNCLKHSGASKARVKLVNNGKEVLLSVSDDGCGFDTESSAMTKGLGFTSMRERVRIVGGEIRIHSQAMHGTLIEVVVPMPQEVRN